VDTELGSLPAVISVRRAARTTSTVMLPGSKSITNRAFVCAFLANGESRLENVLLADDTLAMVRLLRQLGASVIVDVTNRHAVVVGIGDGLVRTGQVLNAGDSGTTSRFALALLALASGRNEVFGSAQLEGRPFGPMIDALRALGADIEELGMPGHLPLAVSGRIDGGTVPLSGDVSSQFVSALLLAGPATKLGINLELIGAPVSRPYIDMTRSVIRAFGGEVRGYTTGPSGYTGINYAIEPDASAASYFMAAAVLADTTIIIPGIGSTCIQGDVRFAEILEQMGAKVTIAESSITVAGSGVLRGIDVDMGDISDTAQTLAAVAVYADGPTRVRGVGFIRGKETDRIRAVVTELRRAGIRADEHDDGFEIWPSPPRPVTFSTYGDHRMVMSLSLLGLKTEGINIESPQCVAKTFPGFFSTMKDAGLLEIGEAR
jgi:3-phosphoshikimate 1-carboxyvinyltransferase